jgi:glycosyltransferase involved in cell wall biosynthesis
MKVCLLSPSAAGNALGRAYSLWLVARYLGWQTSVLVPDMSTIWWPVRGEDEFMADVTTDAEAATAGASALIVVKPLPGSFDRGLELSRELAIPFVLDVDDPDWERAYGETKVRALVSFLSQAARGHPPWTAYRLRRRARSVAPITVSNPSIHRWYGEGTIVPHARAVRPAGREHSDRESLDVAFVGTPRPHKGVGVLRAAVSRIPGTTLTITSPAPPDAQPHERWVGRTGVANGLALVDRADVVVVASSPTVYGRGQLPVKLIDGMMSGRAVIASDLPPLRWALGDSGLIVPPDDPDALTRALEQLRSTELRGRLGALARERAIDMFSVQAVGSVLAGVVDSVVRH